MTPEGAPSGTGATPAIQTAASGSRWLRCAPAGRCRASPRLAAAGLLLGLGPVLADPWGFTSGSDTTRDGRPPPPDWIQGTDGTGGRRSDARGRDPGAGGYGPWAPAGSDADARPAVPSARPGWGGRQTAAPAPAGPPPWSAAPPSDDRFGDNRFRDAPVRDDRYSDYRFRPDGPVDMSAPDGPGGFRGDPAAPAGGYRYRDHAPGPSRDAGAWPDLGGYRFRPLTERERGRQGEGWPARPADRTPDPDFGPGSPWGPVPPYGFGPGAWPSR